MATHPAPPIQFRRRGMTLRTGLVRTLVWGALGILLIRGAVSLIEGPPLAVPAPPVLAVDAAPGATVFAQRFLSAWLSGSPAARFYLATGYSLPKQSLQLPPHVTLTVQGLQVWGVQTTQSHRLAVLFRAQLREAGASQLLYLSVPLIVQGNRVGVDGVPALVPAPARATAPTAPYLLNVAPATIQQQVQTVITAWSLAYTQGHPHRMALLYADGQPGPVLAGTIPGVQLKTIRGLIVPPPLNGALTATATLVLQYHGITWQQPYSFELTNLASNSATNRWLLVHVQPL